MIFLSKNKVRKMSDIDLIHAYSKSGNSAFIGVLFERYYALCYGVCLRYLNNKDISKDAVIQVFEKILNEAGKLEISNFNTWIYSVTKNQCLMVLRTDKRRSEREKKYSEELIITDHQNIEGNKNQELIDAINQLDIHQKQCINLFYFEKKTYKEIAELTGYPLPKIKSYIQNGKRNLKILIHNNDNK